MSAPVATPPLQDVRADFPLFEREVNARPIVYLDSAATSQKPRQVLEAMDDLYRRSNANIHRGVYTIARESTDLFEGARDRVASFVGSDSPTTIFAKTVTEALNLVAYSWGRRNVG